MSSPRRPSVAAEARRISSSILLASILECLASEALFAPHFRPDEDGADSWLAWKAFLAALFALPMDDELLAVYQAQTGRSAPPTKPFTEAAIIVGRRGGKSRVLALIAVFLAMRDYSASLAPGEVATIGVLASDRAQGRAIFNYTLGLLKAVPVLAAMIESDKDDTITLNNRVSIEIRTASFRSTRGYTYVAVLCDEIAFWRSEENSANPDTEILRALRPGMASIKGSILLLASSPYAKRGALYDAYRKNYGKDGARMLVWQGPTNVMNPRIDPEVIAEAYEEDEESAKAEFGAQFRDDLAAFITREIVDAVTAKGRHENPPEAGAAPAAFCDPSGGSNDSMTLAIAHLQGDVAVLDATLEIRAPFDPDQATAQCAELLHRYGISRVVADHYAGQWVVSRFAQHGIKVEQSARSKSDIYMDFLALANAQRVELLDDRRLASQLVNLERRTARSGKDSVDHQPGGHDDLCNAVCGVLVGLDLDRRPMMVKNQALLHEGKPLPEEHYRYLDYVFAVVAVDVKTGKTAIIYAGFSKPRGLMVILDFDYSSMTEGLFQTVANRALALSQEANGPGHTAVFASRNVSVMSRAINVQVQQIPRMMEDPSALALAVSVHISAGKVKLTSAVTEKSKSSPFSSSFDLRSGQVADDDPMRTAALTAVALCLEDSRTFAPPPLHI